MNGELLGMLAEEMRTGLASILGYSRTLELRAKRLTEAERIEFASRISAQAERLARLSDYLQTVARIEDIPDREPADASAVVRAVTAELGGIIDAHGVTTELHLAASLPASAGAKALHQIVASLVLAALQVTEDGSRLLLSTHPSRSQAVVEIVATTARPEASVRLQGLARAEGSPTDTPPWPAPGAPGWTSLGPGTELGLSLVRHLVEAHGGTLDIDLADEAMTLCVEVPQSRDRAPLPGGDLLGRDASPTGTRDEGP